MDQAAFEQLEASLKQLHERGNPFELARLAYSQLAEPLELDMFFNYMVANPGTDLWLASYEGIPASVAREISDLAYGTAVCGSVAATAQRQSFSDIQQSSLPKTELVRSLGAQAYCCVPIMSDSRLFGTVSFGSKRRTHFSSSEIELMQTVGDEIAKALKQLLPRIDQARSSVSAESGEAPAGNADRLPAA